MNTPRFSVIIPTFNRKEPLRACLHALAEQTLDPSDFEVLVAIDGSDDGTREMLSECHAPFHLRALVLEHGGASRARNAGADAAIGEYLAFTEDDVIPDPYWLAHAQKHILEGSLDILEGRTVYTHSRSSVRRFEPHGIPSFIPCNLFVRRQAFLAVGGYDLDFFDRESGLYFREDSDLGFRLLDAGHTVFLAQDVLVAHPPQFDTLLGCIRHARRYIFDPLLYKRHPRRYRKGIEVKEIAGIILRRPQHYVALAALVALLACVAGVIAGNGALISLSTLAVALCGFLFRQKYQGWSALNPLEIHKTLGFSVVPFVYLLSLARGCIRYRSFRILL